MPARYGLAAYKTSQRASLQNPAAILLALHEEICRELMAAKAAYEKKMLDRMCAHTERALRILTRLKSTLNFEAAGQDGRALERYYTTTMVDFSSVLRRENPLRAFEYLIDHTRLICREMDKRVRPS
jgi:flagellin-specific chaperone FliS